MEQSVSLTNNLGVKTSAVFFGDWPEEKSGHFGRILAKLDFDISSMDASLVSGPGLQINDPLVI